MDDYTTPAAEAIHLILNLQYAAIHSEIGRNNTKYYATLKRFFIDSYWFDEGALKFTKTSLVIKIRLLNSSHYEKCGSFKNSSLKGSLENQKWFFLEPLLLRVGNSKIESFLPIISQLCTDFCYIILHLHLHLCI